MNPVQRKSRSQSKMRRSHLWRANRPVATTRCPNCGSAKRPHVACAECGYVRPGLKLNLSQEE
jgi:large subunit ribosomal protein L32